MTHPLLAGILASSLLFYADYDASFDASFSRGDGNVRLIEDRYPPELTHDNRGRFGEAVRFSYDKLDLETVWTHDVLRYPAKGNVPHDPDAPYDGTIGMWMNIDIPSLMNRELIWLDPFHLLANDRERSREQGKIWMDFVTRELDGAPLMRFGATLPKEYRGNPDYADGGRLITVPGIDFTGGEWHHIVGTWKNLNSHDGTCSMTLYIDGEEAGRIENVSHPLVWEIGEWELRIGLAFEGCIDEFFVLDRELSAEETRTLFNTDQPISAMLEHH